MVLDGNSEHDSHVTKNVVKKMNVEFSTADFLNRPEYRFYSTCAHLFLSNHLLPCTMDIPGQ